MEAHRCGSSAGSISFASWRRSSSVLGASPPGGLRGELRPRGEPKLPERVGHVCLDGPSRYEKAFADLRVREPLGHERRDPLLALGEALPARLRSPPGAPPAPPDAEGSEECLGSGDCSRRAEPVAGFDSLSQERDRLLAAIRAGQCRTGVEAARRSLIRTLRLALPGHGLEQDGGV